MPCVSRTCQWLVSLRIRFGQFLYGSWFWPCLIFKVGTSNKRPVIVQDDYIYLMFVICSCYLYFRMYKYRAVGKPSHQHAKLMINSAITIVYKMHCKHDFCLSMFKEGQYFRYSTCSWQNKNCSKFKFLSNFSNKALICMAEIRLHIFEAFQQ